MDYLNRTAAPECLTHRLLEQRAAESPDAPFFTFNDVTTTFGHCNRMANRLARNLQHSGITVGTHVVVFMETSTEYMVLWMALSKLGAVEVPINTAYRGELLTHVLRTCEATHCVLDDRFVDKVAEASGGFAQFQQVIVAATGEGSALPDRGRLLEDFFAPNDEGNLASTPRHHEITCIIFTSGTTGPSKGVMLSHQCLTGCGMIYAEINALRSDDVLMNFLPFFHVAAKFLTIATLACGGRMLLQRRFSISTFWQEVRAHGVTNFMGVGGICNMLVSRPESPDDANTTIRTIYAVPDPADIHAELERRFGCTVTAVYGSTEGGLSICRRVGDPYRPNSCGRVNGTYYEVQIVDEDDNPVPVGTSGEIVVRPRRAFLVGSGYIGMPERTVKAWRNLWLHTGDRGHADADGFFYFDDRISDSIRRRGENISSFEVEAIVAKHPAVSEAIAVPAPSEIGEDEVWVLVVPREGHTLRPEELLTHCSQHMAYFMIPRFIEIVADFPRTETAKVEKYKIRKNGPGPNFWDREAHGWKVTREGLFSSDGAAVVRFGASGTA